MRLIYGLTMPSLASSVIANLRHSVRRLLTHLTRSRNQRNLHAIPTLQGQSHVCYILLHGIAILNPFKLLRQSDHYVEEIRIYLLYGGTDAWPASKRHKLPHRRFSPGPSVRLELFGIVAPDIFVVVHRPIVAEDLGRQKGRESQWCSARGRTSSQ